MEQGAGFGRARAKRAAETPGNGSQSRDAAEEIS